jgi:hypothetical protein
MTITDYLYSARENNFVSNLLNTGCFFGRIFTRKTVHSFTEQFTGEYGSSLEVPGMHPECSDSLPTHHHLFLCTISLLASQLIQHRKVKKILKK